MLNSTLADLLEGPCLSSSCLGLPAGCFRAQLHRDSALVAIQHALLTGLPQCSTGYSPVAPAWALAGEQIDTVLL